MSTCFFSEIDLWRVDLWKVVVFSFDHHLRTVEEEVGGAAGAAGAAEPPAAGTGGASACGRVRGGI